MTRLAKILALTAAVTAVAAVTAACGTQNISVSSSQAQLYHGASLFNQRCAGCHTLSYAATWGSAPNIRTATPISGPNFNIRCERPVDRVLYAIANGGFSGAYMPQNVVVGPDAVDVAKFVATFAGRQAPRTTGVVPCQDKPIGTLPPGFGTTQVASAAGSAPTPSASAASQTTAASTTTAPSPAAAPAPHRKRTAAAHAKAKSGKAKSAKKKKKK